MEALPLELQLRDLEKFEKKFALLKRVSGTLSVLALALFLWIGAPHVEFSIPLAGTTASDLNVGYAIVFGPAIILFFMTWQFMIRRKLEMLMDSFDYQGSHKDIAHLQHTALLISNFRQYRNKPLYDYYWFSNYFLRKVLVFVFPALVAIACIIKLLDLVPMKINGEEVVDWIEEKGEDKSKEKMPVDSAADADYMEIEAEIERINNIIEELRITQNQENKEGRYNCLSNYKKQPDFYPCDWKTPEKVVFWMFHNNWSGTPAILMNRAIERDQDRGGNFPFIYTYTVWLNLLALVAIFWLSFRCNELSKVLIAQHEEKLVSDQTELDEA